MSPAEIYLIRHGETEWSLNGRHTGVSDIPLTEHGRQQARLLVPELVARNFDLVLTSPLRRARETCELAGLAERARDRSGSDGMELRRLRRTDVRPDSCGPTCMDDLQRWRPRRRNSRAGRRPCRSGDRKGTRSGSDAALFAHGHVLRVLAARWLGLAPRAGAHFLLDTGTLCVLSSYGGIPALKRWNVSPCNGRIQA